MQLLDSVQCVVISGTSIPKACRDKHVYNYDEVRRWTTEKKLKRMGQASASVLDCDRVVIPVRFFGGVYIISVMRHTEECACHCLGSGR